MAFDEKKRFVPYLWTFSSKLRRFRGGVRFTTSGVFGGRKSFVLKLEAAPEPSRDWSGISKYPIVEFSGVGGVGARWNESDKMFKDLFSFSASNECANVANAFSKGGVKFGISSKSCSTIVSGSRDFWENMTQPHITRNKQGFDGSRTTLFKMMFGNSLFEPFYLACGTKMRLLTKIRIFNKNYNCWPKIAKKLLDFIRI